MYKIYTDKTENFKCDIKLKGASLSNAFARLVLESKDINLVFKGTIDPNGKCNIPISKLNGLIEEGDKGNLVLEVVADDTYFKPWESEYEVTISKKAIVEVVSQEEESSTPIMEVKVEQEETTPEKTIKEHVVDFAKLLKENKVNVKNIRTNKNKIFSLMNSYVNENHIEKDKKQLVLNNAIKALKLVKK